MTAKRSFANGQLGASSFCSRDFEDRSDLHFIFPTPAVQLARRSTGFRSIFVPLAQPDPGIAYESPYSRVEQLIVEPLVKSAILAVIFIDALDECKDEELASVTHPVLGRFISRIPKMKIFVTGRPELWILEGFRLPLVAQGVDAFVLHEVESSRISGWFFTKNQPSCPNIRKSSCARNRPNHLPLEHSGSTCEAD